RNPSAAANLALSLIFFSNGLKSPLELRIRNPRTARPSSTKIPTRSLLNVSVFVVSTMLYLP
ncbi:MAG: hypothetical protein ABI481_04940, partial [Pyrinomonadaceae bacterium]